MMLRTPWVVGRYLISTQYGLEWVSMGQRVCFIGSMLMNEDEAHIAWVRFWAFSHNYHILYLNIDDCSSCTFHRPANVICDACLGGTNLMRHNYEVESTVIPRRLLRFPWAGASHSLCCYPVEFQGQWPTLYCTFYVWPFERWTQAGI